MTLNTESFEVKIFTSKLHEGQWQTVIPVQGQPLSLTLCQIASGSCSIAQQHVADITTTMRATVGEPAEPVIFHKSKIRGAELTSSYEEDLLLALDWSGA